MASSALPIRMKITTLANDIRRRLKNCGRSIPVEEKVEIMNNFMTKLKISVYSAKLRQEVLEAGLVGYYRILETEHETGIRVNQSQDVGKELREVRRIAGAGTWHKRTPGSHRGKPPSGPRGKKRKGRRYGL